MSELSVRFWGGARTVTGSRHLFTWKKQRLLLECGLFQGHREEAEQINRHFPFKAREVDHCVISHAHIDHVGNFPNLVKRGFRGPALMTPGTAALARLLLLDSAHIQESDIRYLNKQRRKKGEPPKEPIYNTADAEESLKFLQTARYAKPKKLGAFKVAFHDAGHILGSALVDLEVDGRRILFTGDLGRRKMPIIRDPVQVQEADYLIMEATYGNRSHGDYEQVDTRLAEIVNRVVARGGRIVIPAFAVERSQEIVYTLNRLRQDGRIPALPVFVDSPLASKVTEVFRQNPQYYDEEAQELLNGHKQLFDFPGLKYVATVEESRALNDLDQPCIIISASGMCEAGRVLHHLKHSVGDERNLVLLVSFQAPNTLGRRIAEGQRRVRIYGDEFDLRAEVAVMDEFSAHADRQGLLDYVGRMNLLRLKKVFIVHAEPEAAEAMVEPLKALGIRE
ncbi:MBL fold metallo-hydrolase, partial [candidate division WOR-3 bacterium]|nr:MBL fold metallo-hydrolase [candidate division WOR-3 bacterium]